MKVHFSFKLELERVSAFIVISATITLAKTLTEVKDGD
ncbi:hypothetical protein BTN49_3086 [Candidatus Enterovibrio escicola]|uniref:Uncharacterized protein n=1 Tax=Candidatus Enterovibrio escicola TaxID=1927127 RepID=A0A2A5T059_9GAMM|nr:hypothetical protein BTN49_3086 [Candidatus Enterovibrio escacola]